MKKKKTTYNDLSRALKEYRYTLDLADIKAERRRAKKKASAAYDLLLARYEQYKLSLGSSDEKKYKKLTAKTALALAYLLQYNNGLKNIETHYKRQITKLK